MVFSDVAIETKFLREVVWVSRKSEMFELSCNISIATFHTNGLCRLQVWKSCQKILYFGYVFVFGTQRKGKVKGVGF